MPSVALAFALALAAMQHGSPAPKKDLVPPEITKEFQTRARAYLDLKEKAEDQEGKLKPKTSAAQINERKKGMAAAIRDMRAGAQQGDIFTPPVRTYIEQVVRSEMKGPQSKAARRTIREGNPANEGRADRIKLAPNAIYPDNQPISTVPPSLLLRLPKTPDGLAYAFVGGTMILRDTDADLIVDVIPHIVPEK